LKRPSIKGDSNRNLSFIVLNLDFHLEFVLILFVLVGPIESDFFSKLVNFSFQLINDSSGDVLCVLERFALQYLYLLIFNNLKFYWNFDSMIHDHRNLIDFEAVDWNFVDLSCQKGVFIEFDVSRGVVFALG
jgi:hypothetical protein